MAVVPVVVSGESPEEPQAARTNAHSATVKARIDLFALGPPDVRLPIFPV
jgi:hypothetical protein